MEPSDSPPAVAEVKEQLRRLAASTRSERAERLQVALALGAEPLLQALADACGREDRGVRWAAALSLGHLREACAVAALCQLLLDDYPSVRVAAAVALGHIGDAAAVAPLLRAMDEAGKDANIVRATASALASLGDERARAPLERERAKWQDIQSPPYMSEYLQQIIERLEADLGAGSTKPAST